MTQSAHSPGRAEEAAAVARTPAVVLGNGLTALAVVRSLGRGGIPLYLVSGRDDFAYRSRWARGRSLELEQPVDSESLARRLVQAGVPRAVLIPCTDVWSQVVSGLPEGATEHFSTSMPAADVIDLLVDKWLFAEALVRFGVPHPATWELTDVDDVLGHDPKSIFIKPRDSQRFSELFGRKGLRCEDENDARHAVRQVAEAGLTAVIQEYVPGLPSAHYFVDGFVDRHHRVCALFARRRIRMFPLDFGNSSLMVSIPVQDMSDATDGLLRLLHGVEFRGAFSAEFKLDAHDGVFKLLEVNSRPWWYIGFAEQCGVDVSRMICRDALELHVDEVTGYAVGERCVFLAQDIRAYRALRKQGELAFRPWLRSWLGANPSIFSVDDPLPAFALPINFMLRRARARRNAQSGT